MSDIITNTRAAIDRVLCGEATADDVLTCLGVVDRLKQITRDLTEQSEKAVIDWIGQNGELTCGDVRYYVATNKSTKCTDKERAVTAILSASGGDIAALARCMSSDSLKPGACRELLPPDEFDGLFETREVPDLKTGKPRVRLQKFDGGNPYAKRAIGRADQSNGGADVD